MHFQSRGIFSGTKLLMAQNRASAWVILEQPLLNHRCDGYGDEFLSVASWKTLRLTQKYFYFFCLFRFFSWGLQFGSRDMFPWISKERLVLHGSVSGGVKSKAQGLAEHSPGLTMVALSASFFHVYPSMGTNLLKVRSQVGGCMNPPHPQPTTQSCRDKPHPAKSQKT